MHPLFSTCRRRNRLQPYCCSSVAADLLLQRRGTGNSRQQSAALAMDASDPVLTASDSWPGTPAYSAPSQCLEHSTKFPSCAPQSQSRPLHRRLCSNCKCARASWFSHRESTASRSGCDVKLHNRSHEKRAVFLVGNAALLPAGKKQNHNGIVEYCVWKVPSLKPLTGSMSASHTFDIEVSPLCRCSASHA